MIDRCAGHCCRDMWISVSTAHMLQLGREASEILHSGRWLSEADGMTPRNKKTIEPGTRFGRLVVMRESPERSSRGLVMFECKCDCGGGKCVAGARLREGRLKSCGCLAREHWKRNQSRMRAAAMKKRLWPVLWFGRDDDGLL